MENNFIINFYNNVLTRNEVDYETLRDINNAAKEKLNLTSEKNYDSLFISSLLDPKQFNLLTYRNKDDEFLKTSLIAIEQSIVLLKDTIESTIGANDYQIFKRLVQDAGFIYENIFDNLVLLFKPKEQSFYYSYNRSFFLLESLPNLKFNLKAEEETQLSNNIEINHRVLFLSVEIRKILEFYFLECLNESNEFIDKNGNAYFHLKKLFRNVVENQFIIFNDNQNNKLEFLIKSYEFLGSAVHRSYSPPIYTPLYIFKKLLDDFFDVEYKDKYIFRGELILKNIEINKVAINDYLESEIPEYYEKK